MLPNANDASMHVGDVGDGDFAQSVVGDDHRAAWSDRRVDDLGRVLLRRHRLDHGA
jgi:hypothetical protein